MPCDDHAKYLPSAVSLQRNVNLLMTGERGKNFDQHGLVKAVSTYVHIRVLH